MPPRMRNSLSSTMKPEDAARQARVLRQQMRGLARQASLDPADGLEL